MATNKEEALRQGIDLGIELAKQWIEKIKASGSEDAAKQKTAEIYLGAIHGMAIVGAISMEPESYEEFTEYVQKVLLEALNNVSPVVKEKLRGGKGDAGAKADGDWRTRTH